MIQKSKDVRVPDIGFEDQDHFVSFQSGMAATLGFPSSQSVVPGVCFNTGGCLICCTAGLLLRTDNKTEGSVNQGIPGSLFAKGCFQCILWSYRFCPFIISYDVM